VIKEGFSLKPLVWLSVWTGRGEDLEKVQLPDPVTVRRYTVGDKLEAEARLIALIMSKVEITEDGPSIAERYFNEAVIPTLCHFLMVYAPTRWVRIRRRMGLTDYSARAMGSLLTRSRLDVRDALNAVSRLTLNVEFGSFERDILEAVTDEEEKKQNQLKMEAQEAEFYYGLMANLGLTLDDIRGMTYYEIGRLCDAAGRKANEKPIKGHAVVRSEMGY